MDSYQVALSWGLFGAAAVGCCYYYWPAEQTRSNRAREEPNRRQKNEQNARQRLSKRSSESDMGSSTAADGSGNAPTRKRKVQTREPPQAQQAPAVVVHAEEPEDIDMSTRAFAAQMAQNRKGTDLTSTKNKESRVKTIKQSSALNTPVLSSGSSQAGADGDDDLSPAVSPALEAGGVSDMLEPKAAGPSSMRLTAPTKPQKEKAQRQPKEEVVETKKQRQNRQRVEAQRQQREAEEKERKALEEKQRRSAREARGEPARNGIAVSKPPTSNAWTAPKLANGNAPAPAVQSESITAPLLDTFDAESTSSSNGGPALSTAATSTTSAGATQRDHDMPSEEAQLAQAMRQSEDESGWTTVAQPKKQKKTATSNEAPEVKQPVLSNKTNVTQPSKPMANGKPKGFQALEVEYEQRTDADPSDASNWDA